MEKQKITLARIKASNRKIIEMGVDDYKQNDIVFLYQLSDDKETKESGHCFSRELNPDFSRPSKADDLYWLPNKFFKCIKTILI